MLRVATYAFAPPAWFVVLIVSLCLLLVLLRHKEGIVRAAVELIGCMTVVPGSLWTTGDSSTGYRVLKVLTKDKGGVHVRMYPKTLAERPTSEVDISYLEQDEFVVSAHRRYSAGVGHLPVSWISFFSSDPVLFQFDSVNESEMEGYQIWLEAEGCYW